MEVTERKKQILEFAIQRSPAGIADIVKHLPGNPAISTVNRDLKTLVEDHLLIKSGKGRSTVYKVSPAYRLIYSSISDSYFDKDLDERKGNRRLDPEVFSHLKKLAIFTPEEL